jgi:hypothetical protein
MLVFGSSKVPPRSQATVSVTATKTGDTPFDDRAEEPVKEKGNVTEKGSVMNVFDNQPSTREVCWPCQTRAGEFLLGAIGFIIMVVVLYVQHH